MRVSWRLCAVARPVRCPG